MKRAPRVLVSGVVLGQPAGGVRRHNAELLPRLAKLLEANGGALAVLEGRERIEFALPRSVERIASDVPDHPVIARMHQEAPALEHALKNARDRGAPFDIVHTAHFPVPRKLGVPLTITLHDLRSLDSSVTPFLKFAAASMLIHKAMATAARIFTVSATVAAQVRARYSYASPHTTVIGNGVDHFTPMARDAGADAPIVCVGHLERRKNLEVVLRALAYDWTLPPVELHGAAKDGEDDRLRALAQEFGVASRVSIAGPFSDEDLPAIYARAACVCIPSKLEGFGIVALEAQRAGVPLCVANAGALPEVAGAGVPLFHFDDAAQCTWAIRAALARTSDALERDAQRANEFTWDRSARLWFEALLETDANPG